jgi:hypothetical protein
MAASTANGIGPPVGSSRSTDFTHALTSVDAEVLKALLGTGGTPPGPEQVWNQLLKASGGQAPA